MAIRGPPIGEVDPQWEDSNRRPSRPQSMTLSTWTPPTVLNDMHFPRQYWLNRKHKPFLRIIYDWRNSHSQWNQRYCFGWEGMFKTLLVSSYSLQMPPSGSFKTVISPRKLKSLRFTSYASIHSQYLSFSEWNSSQMWIWFIPHNLQRHAKNSTMSKPQLGYPVHDGNAFRDEYCLRTSHLHDY